MSRMILGGSEGNPQGGERLSGVWGGRWKSLLERKDQLRYKSRFRYPTIQQGSVTETRTKIAPRDAHVPAWIWGPFRLLFALGLLIEAVLGAVVVVVGAVAVVVVGGLF